MLWVRKTVKTTTANWTGSPSWLLAFDSNEPTGERKLVSTSGHFVKPILTPNADYVVYTEVIGGNPYDSTNWSGDIYSIKWDGTAKTKILDKSAGYMCQDVWKDPLPSVIINPSTLSFVMDENGASPTSKKISAKDGANATITAMTATSNKTWLTVAVSGDSISNTVSGTGHPSGLDTAVVSIYSSGNIKAKYNVYLRINAPAYLATISIMPGTISLKSGESQQFAATAKDQFSAPFTGTLTWSTMGGQTITQSGLFTMGSTPARSVVKVGGANGLSASADVAVTPSTLEPLFWGTFSKMLALEDSTGNYHIMGKTITQALLPGETQNGFNGYIPTKDAPVKIDGKTYYWRQDSTSGFGGDWMTDTSKSGFSSYFGMMVYSTRDRYVKIHSGHGDGVRVWVNGKLVLSNNAGAGEYTDTFMLKTAIIDNNSIMKQRGVARLNVMRNRIVVTVPTASTIIIRDVLGRTLLSQQIVGQTTVSTAGFARGIYYIELHSSRQRLHKMFCQM